MCPPDESVVPNPGTDPQRSGAIRAQAAKWMGDPGSSVTITCGPTGSYVGEACDGGITWTNWRGTFRTPGGTDDGR